MTYLQLFFVIIFVPGLFAIIISLRPECGDKYRNRHVACDTIRFTKFFLCGLLPGNGFTGSGAIRSGKAGTRR